MVESIFGGKAAYPLGCHERNVLNPRLADRRLSVPSTHLKTISETAGDDGGSPTFASPVEENIASDGPTFYRRPRTMSLPAIYRDGSYLRIKRSSNTLSPCKRRYSEPGGITQHIIHRLSLRSIDSDESENGSCKRPSVRSMEATYSARESGFSPDSTTPRRHSDPTCYVTERVDRLGISQERRSRATKKLVTCPAVPKTLSGSIKQPDNEQASQTAVVRRRKSSVVPVPFNSVQQQKASHSQLSNRPMSFPPSKKDSKRQCNLPELKTEFLTGHSTDCNNNNEERLLSEEQALESEDKYTANADILVQWMKFFG